MPYSDPEKQRESNRIAAQRAREKGVIPSVIPDENVIPVIPRHTENHTPSYPNVIPSVIPSQAQTVIPASYPRHTANDTLRSYSYVHASNFRAMAVVDLRRAVPFLVTIDGEVIGVTRIDVEGAIDVV